MIRKFLFVSLTVTILFSNCVTTIKPGEVGLRWYPWSSGLSKDPLGPSLYGYSPWNDIIIFPTTWQSYMEKVEVLTKDDLTIMVSATVILRPKKNEIYELQTDIGRDYYEKIVKPEFRTSVRNVLSIYSMISISKETPKISHDIKEALVIKIKGKHMDIDDVIIDDIMYSKPILKAIETKLTKEQEQEQMKFEINIAGRDAEITIIKAKAHAQAEIIKAEGQAKALKIINKELSSKYIQLKAVENPNAKYILTPTGKDGVPVILNPGD